MRKLARIFGFGRERAADAAQSKRKRSVRENLQKSFSKQKSPKKNFTNSDLTGTGMGGATKKLMHAMQADRERTDGAFAHVSMRGASADVPRPTESGVFVTSPRSIDIMAMDIAPEVDERAIEEVTLIVYGWENVQPGTLSWVFPSLRSALAAVRAMRNAVRWAVLHGIVSHENDAARDVESARESGRVLVEAS